MKPSNTGIEWRAVDIDGMPGLSEMDVKALCEMQPRLWDGICEWAAQIAIAEYRKELAARAEKRLTRYYPNGENDMGASDYGEYYERVEVLALINENDDENRTQ